MRRRKKTAIMLAVMGLNAISVTMDNSPTEWALESMSKAEAAFQYIPINEVSGEGHVTQGVDNYVKGVAPEDGFLLIGSGNVDDIHVIVDGKEIAYNYADWSSTTVPIAAGSSYEIYDSDGGFNNGGIYFVKTPLSSSTIEGATKEILKKEGVSKKYIDDVAKGKANVSLNNITDSGKQVIKNTVAGDISAAENRAKADATNKANAAEARAKQDATNKANTAENNAKSYTDIVTDAAKTYAKTYTDEVAKGKANISMNNINEAGEQVIRDLAKNEIKNSGIDATGGTIIINKPMETKDIHVDGGITTTGGVTAGGNIHGKDDLEIDGKTHLHGDTEIDKNLTVHGNERIDGSLDVGGDSHIHGSQTVDGDSHVKGNETVDKNLTVHGNETVDDTLHVKDNAEFDKDVTVHGSETIDKGLHVKGNSETDGNATVHGSQTVDKDLNVKGNTTLGDNATDKLTVNATSEFKANATFDMDVHIKGNLETDGNAVTHGNQIIDGDLTVKGNTVLGDDKDKDTVDVNAKANLHGDTTIGDNADDRLVVNATSEFKADADFDKDVHIKGNAEVDKNMTVHGDTVLDGKFFATGATQFGDDLDIAKNLTVGGNAFVKQNLGVEGNAYVDGDIYGRSFNVGNERYIDANGINANNHKIRNVADGEISPNSLDAVNGRQLYHAREALQYDVNQVGAGAAAMANLHPLEFEHNDKISVSAAVGNYKSETAMAVGAFYRPNPKTMFSVSGSFGSSENMIGAGVSTKFGKVSEIDQMNEEQLKDKIETLNESNESLKGEVSELSKKNSLLETSLSEVKNAYNALMAKVDGLMAKIGLSNTAEK